MKTKEQVAQEIKQILEDNGMMMVSVTRFEDHVEDASYDVHLISKEDRYNNGFNRSSILINRE